LVTKIRSGGAAESAGLEVGDVILSVNKATITSPGEMQEEISNYRPGDRIEVSYIRNQREEIILITLSDKNNSTRGRRLASLPKVDPFRRLGFEVRPLSPTEQNQLQLKGLRVISVFRNTKIASTKMTANYIIVKANDKPVTQLADLLELIEGDDEVLLEGYYEGYEGAYFYRF
jgi:S1-C subfamily serine protease